MPSPFSSPPQQTGVPSVSSAQVCVALAAIAVKVLPVGGVARPSGLRPQQCVVPSASSAQLCWRPLSTELNCRSLGASSNFHALFSPQHWTYPSVLMPQEW